MPLLVVLTGPSGVGKDTVARRLEATLALGRVITCTSRPRRAGEVDGENYRFLSPERFAEGLEAGEFAESALVYGHRYGVLRSDLDEPLAAGIDLLVLLDVQGARSLKAAYPAAWVAFLRPPHEGTLESRLAARGADSERDRARRLASAPAELAALGEEGVVDAVFTNDDLDDCVASLTAAVAQLLAAGDQGR